MNRGLTKNLAIGVVGIVIVVAVIVALFLSTQQPMQPREEVITQTPTRELTAETQIITETETVTSPVEEEVEEEVKEETEVPPPPAPTIDLKAFYEQYIADIEARDVENVVAKFDAKGVSVWKGRTGGLGGTYSGPGTIRLLYVAALSVAKAINVDVLSYEEGFEGDLGIITSTININGESNVLGKFDGTIKIVLKVRKVGDDVKIVEEEWDFQVFNYENQGKATTFPQWSRIGTGKPIELNPSKDIKDFFWVASDYAAAMLYSLAILLGAAALKRGSRLGKR